MYVILGGLVLVATLILMIVIQILAFMETVQMKWMISVVPVIRAFMETFVLMVRSQIHSYTYIFNGNFMSYRNFYSTNCFTIFRMALFKKAERCNQALESTLVFIFSILCSFQFVFLILFFATLVVALTLAFRFNFYQHWLMWLAKN